MEISSAREHSGIHISLIILNILRSIPGRTWQHFVRNRFPFTHFLGNANIMFWPKNQEVSQKYSWSEHICSENRIHNLCITWRPGTPLRYRCVVCFTLLPKFCYLAKRLIIDQILRKRFFSKIVPVFEKNLSASRWNLPGYFSVSFRFPQVTEFGKSTAMYLADSFCQLYSALWSSWQEDPNDPQERCAMARTSCARL